MIKADDRQFVQTGESLFLLHLSLFRRLSSSIKYIIPICIVICTLCFGACEESSAYRRIKTRRVIRRRRKTHVVADAPITLGLTKLKHDTMPKADFTQALAQTLRPEMMNEVFNLVRVKDGDTIVLSGPSGEYTVRLLGINTPEMRDSRPLVRYFAEQAKSFVIKQLDGKKILLGLDPINKRKHHTDSFGRLLAYVYTADDSTHINAEIIRQGYGFSFVKYPCMFTDYFSALEREARSNKLGLWHDQLN